MIVLNIVEISLVIGAKYNCKCLDTSAKVHHEYPFGRKSSCVDEWCNKAPVSAGWWWSQDGSYGSCPGMSFNKGITSASFSILGCGAGASWA